MYDLGIAFTSEGFDELTSKLDAIHGRVGKVVNVLNLDDEAKAKNALQTKALSDQIDRNIISYSGATSAVLEYQAKLIGQSDALAAQIALLKQAEQAQKALGEAEKMERLHSQGIIEDNKRNARDHQAALDKKVADEKKAAAESARIQKDAQDYLSSLRKQETADAATALAQRNKLDADSLKQRQSEYDKLMSAAREELAQAVDIAQKKAREEIAWARKSADERIAILKDFQAMQAHPNLGTGAATAKFGSAAAANIGGLSGLVSEQAAAQGAKHAEKLAFEEIAWANKSWTARNAIMQQASAALANDAISKAAVIEKFGAAAVKGLADHTGHMTAYEQSLKNVGAHGHKTGQTLKEMFANVNLLTGQARQELVVLAHELVQGRYTRFAQSLMVLAEYGGLATIATSAVGLSIIAVGVAMVGTLVQIAKGTLEVDKMNAALTMTGGVTGMTVGTLNILAQSASKAASTIGVAKEILTALAATGRFTGEMLASVGPAVVAMAQVSGLSIKELSQQFESLAKSPTKSVETLNEQFHFLTVTTYRQIAAMEEQGNRMGAAALAMSSFAEEGLKRSNQLIENLGWLASGWHKVEAAASEAKDAIMKWGAKDSTTDKLLAANAEVLKYEELIGRHRKAGSDEKGFAFQSIVEPYLKAFQERNALAVQFGKEFEAQQAKSWDTQTSQEAVDAAKRNSQRRMVNYSQDEKGQVDSARALNDYATEAADVLLKAGVIRSQLDEANKFAVASSTDTTGKMLGDAGHRWGSLVALAKQYKVNITDLQSSLSDQLRRIDLRRNPPDKTNASFVETNRGFSNALRDFEEEKKLNDARIAESGKLLATEKRVASDRWAQAKDTSKALNDLNIASLSAHLLYVSGIASAEEKHVKTVKNSADALMKAADNRFSIEMKLAATQKIKTADDKANVLAKEAQAWDNLNAARSAYNITIGKVDSEQDNANTLAMSAILTASTKDITTQIELLQRKYGAQLREYNLMGASETARRKAMLTEKAAGQEQVANDILAAQMALDENANNATLVAGLQQRIKELQTLQAELRKMAKLEADVYAKQTSAMAGLEAAVTKYRDGVADQFKSTEAAASRAFKGMEDSLVSFLTTGKGKASDFFRSLAADMIRLAVQQRIMSPLLKMIFGGQGLAGGFSGIVTGSMVAGGIMGAASGGAVGAGSVREVNERGPELLSVGNKQYLMMGSQGGNVTPNGGYGSGSGGGQQITVVINQTVGDVATVSMLRANNDQLVKQIRGGIARSQKYAGSMH